MCVLKGEKLFDMVKFFSKFFKILLCLVIFSFNFTVPNFVQAVFEKQQSLSVEFCDDDYAYMRGGTQYDVSGSPDVFVLSKSLINKFCPNFSGRKCQLVFQTDNGYIAYGSPDSYFVVDEKNDIYTVTCRPRIDVLGKVSENYEKFWKKVGGKRCLVSLFENCELIKKFNIVLHKSKALENEELATRVSHLTKSEILKFNKITKKEKAKWLKKVKRQESENAQDEWMNANAVRSTKSLDFEVFTRNWFFPGCPLSGKLPSFLKLYSKIFFKIGDCSKNKPVFLCYSDLKNDDESVSQKDSQKAYIYFSPTWFIKNFGLSENENFKNWRVQIVDKNANELSTGLGCVQGPIPEGDFCLADVSVPRIKVNDLLKYNKVKRQFKFKSGEIYEVRLFRNKKICKKNLVCSVKVKAAKKPLSLIYVGKFDDIDHFYAKDFFICYEEENYNNLSKFAHLAEFPFEYYRNLLVNHGADEITWRGKVNFAKRKGK